MVLFLHFASDADLFFELESGHEEVLQRVPEGLVYLVHQHHELWMVKTLIAKKLSDVGVIFLFYMGIVVFLIGPSANKLYCPQPIMKMPSQKFIQKLTAVV